MKEFQIIELSPEAEQDLLERHMNRALIHGPKWKMVDIESHLGRMLLIRPESIFSYEFFYKTPL